MQNADGQSQGSASRPLADLTIAVLAESEVGSLPIIEALAHAGVTSILTYASEEKLLTAAENAPSDVVVVAWERLGGEQALSLRRLKAVLPRAAHIVVANSFARASVATALDSGLDGFVSEGDIDECLALAIEVAQRGQVSLPREFVLLTARPALSVREKQILALVVMGFSNAEIAKKLFVTESTVKSHLSSAFACLGVRSRTQATALILDPEHGLGAGILGITGDEQAPRRS